MSLERADEPAPDRALELLRGAQPIIDGWAASLDSALAIARISPTLRRRRTELLAQSREFQSMDLATRTLRVIARRIDFLVRDGVARPGLDRSPGKPGR